MEEEFGIENHSKTNHSPKSTDNVNIKKICRICLSQFDLGISLFEPNETLNNATAASLVWNCFRVEIYKSDGLPAQICNECAMNILISHNFKIQLQQSHRLLRSQFPEKERETKNIFERGFHIFKLEENLYRITVEDVNEDENELDDNTNDYVTNLVHKLEIGKKLKIEKDSNVLVVVAHKPSTTESAELVSEQSDGQTHPTDVPGNLEEAQKWLKSTKHLGPPYECKLCGRTYLSRYPAFYTHVRLHFVTKIQCSRCPVKYLPNRAKYHMRTHTKEKPFTCPSCSKSFTMKNHLNRHMKFRCDVREKLEKGNNVCLKCKKTFATKKLLHTHLIKEHRTCQHEERRGRCVICKKNNENKCVCEYCGIKVTRYNRHLKTCKAAPATGKFQSPNSASCDDERGKQTVSKYQLPRFVCTVCGRVFLRKQYLKDHTEIHRPGKYPCEKCGKIFSRRLLLKAHRRTHATIASWKHECGTCDKRFRTKDHLNKHLVVHTKAKPHTCAICNKSFGFKGNLNQHLLIHVKVKYFACAVCGRTFAAEGNLVKHKLSHDLLSTT